MTDENYVKANLTAVTSEMQKQLIADERERKEKNIRNISPEFLSPMRKTAIRSEELLFTFFSLSEVLKMAHFEKNI